MRILSALLFTVLAIAIIMAGCSQPSGPGKTEVYNLGDTGPAGGRIFYISSDPALDGFTYLEAGPEDAGSPMVWSTTGDELGTTGTGVGEGEANTGFIVGQGGAGTYAARYCSDLSIDAGGDTFDDWFLPSIGELEEMYDVLHNITTPLGNFESDSGDYYHSSSENTGGIAPSCYAFNFDAGTRHDSFSKTGSSDYVRPIRAF